MSDYESNLKAPDLRPYFKLRNPPLQLFGGHDSPSDPDFDPDCTYWTRDEAAILYHVARTSSSPHWVDIGARFGWTAAHLAAAGCWVTLVDPEFAQQGPSRRMESNLEHCWDRVREISRRPSRSFFAPGDSFNGAVIDGCHDSPEPLRDATEVAAHSSSDCIILLHDFQGPAVRDAVRWLMDNGWRCRVYWTPNQVACCWRGHKGWMPPDHVRDPKIDWRPHEAQMHDFEDYWGRCE